MALALRWINLIDHAFVNVQKVIEVPRSRIKGLDKISLIVMVKRIHEKVQVGKDQENAQSERDSHSKTEVGKNQTNYQALIP